jgi:hypothetical protein
MPTTARSRTPKSRIRISGSLSLAFSAHTCRAHRATFPTTLTTTALDRSSSGRFAAIPCRTATEGHQTNGPAPPSPVQLRLHSVRPSTSSLLRRPWHTQNRTQDVLVRQPQLALQAAGDLAGDHRPDRLDGTSTGLKVYARLDPGEYVKGIKVSDAELAAVNIVRDQFHPDWNYMINPNPPQPTTAVITS